MDWDEAEKAFHKILHLFMIKKNPKHSTNQEWRAFPQTSSIYEKLTANIRLYGKILKAFPRMRNETKEKEIKKIQTGKEKVQHFYL